MQNLKIMIFRKEYPPKRQVFTETSWIGRHVYQTKAHSVKTSNWPDYFTPMISDCIHCIGDNRTWKGVLDQIRIVIAISAVHQFELVFNVIML